jgi:glyoxylase-like metal-dependent hydrolase (beta-lactamase superfamily II)
VAIVNGVFTLPHLTKTVSMGNNVVLDVPGKPRILHTPGHTEGEVVLWFDDKKVLISGDTIVTRNLLTGALGQPQLTNPILTGNYKEAMRSLDLLRELGNVTMFSGHGTPWVGDMNDAVNIALDNAQLKS